MVDDIAAVPGWLSQQEMSCLTELARNKRVMEIGSYHGRSTVVLARVAEHVHAIDWHRGGDGVGDEWTLPRLVENLHHYGLEDKVTIHVGKAWDVASVLRGQAFDLSFIDGAHDYRSVITDLNIARQVTKPGGVIACHDAWYSQIMRACHESIGWDDDNAEVADSIRWKVWDG